MDPQSIEEIKSQVASVAWYHTVDLGNGIETPGAYDLRPYLPQYGLADSYEGKTVLDVGAASGFFSFEFEKRGATVLATDIDKWAKLDTGPNYVAQNTTEALDNLLVKPFEIAKDALESKVIRKTISVYDLSPDTVGMHDIVFSGSMLLHLSDPVRALWRMASVTKEKAIISTQISADTSGTPTAYMAGYKGGDVWWLPSRSCLELMAATAGFAGIEWIGASRLDYSSGDRGPYHGFLHAYKTTEGWTENTISCEELIERQKGLEPGQSLEPKT